MRVDLQHKLFTHDPYQAFATRYKTDPRLWREIYDNRYVWHQYEIPILCEYFKLKTKLDISDRTIRRWIKRTQLYKHAQPVVRMGAKEASYTYFQQYVTENELKELMKLK